MGFKTAFRRFFDLEETVNPSELRRLAESEEVGDRASRWPMESGKRVVALQNIRHQEKVVLVEPKAFEQVEDIVGHLKARRTVICNLQSVSRSDGRRILDFMSGTIFALDGQIRKIGKNTFLFAPESVDISGIIHEHADD
ncbi:DUF552 domain-containing protein [Sporolactobacillus sp. THM7-7]|nr:DUF552 domain-containing protein [Sporolactobacillus sp. THM7-7]